MSSKTSALASRLLFIDSLRAIAAIYVVMHHAMINFYDPVVEHMSDFSEFKLSGIRSLIIKFFYQGHYAVDLFIVLSGFSLMLSVIKYDYQLKDGLLLFLKRRAIRILPTYYAAIILSLVLIFTLIGDTTQTHWDRSLPVNVFDVVTHFLLIHDFFNSTVLKINHVFWSIVVECRIYLFFPLLLWLWHKSGALLALSFSLIVSVLGFIVLVMLNKFLSDDLNMESSGISPYILLFTFGMLAADLAFKKGKTQERIRALYKQRSLLFIISGLIIAGVIIGLGKTLVNMDNPGIFDYEVLYSHLKDISIGFLCAIFLFATTLLAIDQKRTSLLMKVLNWQPLVFIGTFSYSLYLVHPLALQVITKFIIIPMHYDRFTSAIVLTIMGTGASIVVGYLFFLGFELPFLKLGQRGKIKPIEQETVINPAA